MLRPSAIVSLELTENPAFIVPIVLLVAVVLIAPPHMHALDVALYEPPLLVLVLQTHAICLIKV